MLVSVAKPFKFRVFLANWLVTISHERLYFCPKVQCCEYYLFLLRMLFILLIISPFHYHHLSNQRKKILCANYSFASLYNFTIYLWLCKQHILKKHSINKIMYFSIFYFIQYYFWEQDKLINCLKIFIDIFLSSWIFELFAFLMGVYMSHFMYIAHVLFFFMYFY